MLHIVEAIEGTKDVFAQTLANQTRHIELINKETQLSILGAVRGLPTLLQPVVEAAVQRSLALDRAALEDSSPEEREPDARSPADDRRPPTGRSNHYEQLVKSDQTFIAIGPKRQRTKKATSYPYRFGSVTIIQRHTQRLDREGTNAPVLDAKQTTIVVSFNSWFLKMAVALEYGTAMASLGQPLLGLQLRAFYTVDGSSPVVQAIRAADYVKFRQLLIDRKATPFDTIEEHGKRAGSLFSFVVEQFPYFQDMVGEAGKTTALLQMAQLLVASGVDCDGSHSLLLLARPKIPKRSDLDNIMTRMVLENSKDDPLSYVHVMTNVNRNWKAAILGQEHWDTTEAETEFDVWNGEGAWQRVMVEGLDYLSWQLEQTAAWNREPRRVRHSRTTSQTKYGVCFCYDDWYIVAGVVPWLRLRWRELRPSVRHSLQACEKELEVQDFAEQFERLCDEERWKKEPAEVKLSREETEKKYGRGFVQKSSPVSLAWVAFPSWDYLTGEEELLSEDWTGSKYSEDSIEDYDENAENSDEGSNDSHGSSNLDDASSVDDSSHDSEYETADED